MVTILTNNSVKKNNKLNKTFNNINYINNNIANKSMTMNNSFCGKIVSKKVYNKYKNKLNKTSFYLNNNNNFIKDEKNEINLNKFLNKYTNGEYGNNINNDKIINNKNLDNNTGIMNLKEEIEKYEKEMGYNLSDDEIEKQNNYNEKEEEKKYLMEGKI